MTNDELTQVILSANLLSSDELEKALLETRKLKRPLERVILDMHILDKDALYMAVAQHIGVQYKDLKDISKNPDLLKVYPEDLSRNTQSVPLKIDNNFLHIAMQDPSNVSYIDQIQLFTGYPLEVYLASADDIDSAIKRIYYKTQELTKDMFSGMRIEEGQSSGESTSIVKVVDLIISQAVTDRASDIHIEPEQHDFRVRFRIDGILHEIPAPPKAWESSIISRIKVLAAMDIAESRSPQDGHFQSTVNEKVIDFRVSTLPTIFGENIVMRLLDTASVTIGLERMGFTTYEDLQRYEELICKPYGIILSTGPTGCGKTTTLYSALMRINTTDRNIITLEDPVEYRLGLIRQVQINPKAGITFVNGLRAILRQDPDVIMVGEIRDLETARMAVQAALTGHLVFSTLHTNDAPGAIARLVDMGVEPFLISASLIGVMAQRLVRLVCPKCKYSYRPSKATLKKWSLENQSEVEGFRGKGCEECKGTGFSGRTGIFELMTVDDEMKEMIINSASSVAIKKKAREIGMRVLSEDGRDKVLKGVTTFEEIARVCEDRVEMKEKPVVVEAKPYVKPAADEEPIEGKQVPHRIVVPEKDLEEYRARIARWLNKKG
ncbi:MAG: GspE/PulE family protein [Candidatus Omnitrophota bacterium]